MMAIKITPKIISLYTINNNIKTSNNSHKDKKEKNVIKAKLLEGGFCSGGPIY
jgi:hypothetical protein